MKTDRLNHALGHHLELISREDALLWRYDYGSRPKPFFHPLCTPRGFCLSLFEPSDHVWHRGLWFAIKFVNGENFWEENDEYGRQVTPVPPLVEHYEDGSFSWLSHLHWERPAGAGVILKETRRITYRALSETSYALDWDISLHAEEDVFLDRTPFTTWGGYGGLTMRGNRNWVQTRLLFPYGRTDERPKGLPATWCDFAGTFDGGANCSGGIALLDHPQNVRHPSPWYGATGSGHYVNAAFLFHEPMRLERKTDLTLRYRALVHDEMWEAAQLRQMYQNWLQLPGQPSSLEGQQI